MFGKKVNELQSDVIVADDEVLGTHQKESITKTYDLSKLVLETK